MVIVLKYERQELRGDNLWKPSYFCNGRCFLTQSETVYDPLESDYVIYTSGVCCPRQMIDNQKKFPVRRISRIPHRLNFLKFSLEVWASLILASEKTAI